VTGTALLVDGQNLFMRSMFAARHSQMSAHGVPTGPLVLFINSLALHVRREEPSRLVILWDGGTSAARTRALPSYKARRRPVPEEEKRFRDDSAELVARFCALAAVPGFRLTGVEADDLIAGAWASLRPADAEKIVVLSSDKDFLQMLGANPHGIPTEQLRLSSAGTPTDRWTEARVTAELGHTPAQWPLVTALAGDTGDGVPGLPGIGVVRAMKLLKAANWDLAEAVATRGEDDRKLVEACRFCVDLRALPPLPVAVPPWRPSRQDSPLWPGLIEFLSAYELRDIQDRIQDGSLWSDRDLITAPTPGGNVDDRAG
jgi:5'-3' exonuclease